MVTEGIWPVDCRILLQLYLEILSGDLSQPGVTPEEKVG